MKDLDALVPEDLEVKLGGINYTLPGDLPLEIYLRMNKAGEMEDEDETAALDLVVGAMSDLFSWRYKDKPEGDGISRKVEGVLRSRGVKFNLTLLRELYGNVSEEEPQEEGDVENPQ